MKTAFFLLLTFVSLRGLGQLKAVEVQVGGLSCALCSKTVQKSLEKISFIGAVKPDLNSQEFRLVFRENSFVDLEQIKKQVEDAGFSVARLQVVADFGDVPVESNSPVKIGSLQFQLMDAGANVLKGEHTLTLTEKDFLSAKAFKKYCGNSLQKCSAKTLSPDGSRIYKVVI
ncbi:heavy-metal-associated domain-containing protein [Flavisolibacter nicotianae]|uniref:heavy-metal-associated domain-containing protein n=1 Tax=Flavisolibacter nicotianae TaxID=2364882 RepID=UPI000EB5B62D|nr:heavy-metal-associated domain-containing protein [Flavisolibacter nicotianae]